ncbi:hypothetical protein [Ciceribacter ferrooxidans]|uniref:Uncharacterized protein n=1 Tax=Ciceribacter ferrooxidans TaxID=2509717 RepID=A0A4Q2T0H1_9HYPH|nr:hypothetical protein [Ciceribacter ferrooxidans]RYC10168.1 hypothetical protein EUU22_19065 [Ciceribacter ferrooxidans]
MASLLATIRAAVRPGSQPDALDAIEGEPDASASILEEPHSEAQHTGGDMSVNQTVAGAAQAATETIAAVAAASGGNDGFKAAVDRFSAVLGADGIKGDARRMSAALDLATASPDMAADAVVSFVTDNVPASTTAAAPDGTPAAAEASAPQQRPAAGAYEAQVQAAANLAMAGNQSPMAESGLHKAVTARIEAMKSAR